MRHPGAEVFPFFFGGDFPASRVTNRRSSNLTLARPHLCLAAPIIVSRPTRCRRLFCPCREPTSSGHEQNVLPKRDELRALLWERVGWYHGGIRIHDMTPMWTRSFRSIRFWNTGDEGGSHSRYRFYQGSLGGSEGSGACQAGLARLLRLLSSCPHFRRHRRPVEGQPNASGSHAGWDTEYGTAGTAGTVLPSSPALRLGIAACWVEVTPRCLAVTV